MEWWHWPSKTRRAQAWVASVAGPSVYPLRFDTTVDTAHIDYNGREIVVNPTLASKLSPPPPPYKWGATVLRRAKQIEVFVARAAAEHEALHYVLTRMPKIRGGAHMFLWNALEDGRIERLAIKLHARAYRDCYELGRIMWRKGMVPGEDRFSHWLNACLYHRWAANFGANNFSVPDQRKWDEIRPLVEAAWRANHATEVADIAHDILRRLGYDPTANQPEGVMVLVGGARGDPEPGASDAPTAQELARQPDAQEPQSEQQHDRDQDTDRAGIDHDASGGVGKPEPFEHLLQATRPMVRRLAEELRVRSEDAGWERNDTRGNLHVPSHIATRGESPLRRKTEVGDDPKGLRVVALIDGSGSMAQEDPVHGYQAIYRSCREATLLIYRACQEAGVPIQIAWCTDSHPAAWLCTFDTPTTAEGPAALIAGMYGRGGTDFIPGALEAAHRALQPYPKDTRLVLVIHDGAPDDEHAVQRKVEELRRKRIVVVGIFISPASVREWQVQTITKMFGEGYAIVVPGLDRLAPKLARILKKYRYLG